MYVGVNSTSFVSKNLEKMSFNTNDLYFPAPTSVHSQGQLSDTLRYRDCPTKLN